MTILRRMVQFWGVCDLIVLLWYLWACYLNGETPFMSEIAFALHTPDPTDPLMSAYLTVSFLLLPLLYVSTPFSGYLLLRQRKAGAILSYIQAPARLIVGPMAASLPFFFMLAPVRNALLNSMAMVYMALLLTEAVKIGTLVVWRAQTPAA